MFETALETANFVTCLHSVIMTISGIGFVNGGMILGEVGDIHRFPAPNKLLAFAGLNPTVYQSGNSQAKRTRMSKRGSKVLRYALMNAAHNVVTTPLSRLTTMSKERRAGHTTLPSAAVSANSSGTSERCSLTM